MLRLTTVLMLLLLPGFSLSGSTETRDGSNKRNGSNDKSVRASRFEDVLSRMDGASRRELQNEGFLNRFFFSPEDAWPELLPDTFADGNITDQVVANDPTMGVESLYLLPYPEGEGFAGAWEKSAKILFQVSTMEGIEYYSASRKRMRTLFTDSYFIEEQESRKRVPDPLFSTIPESFEQPLLQKDLTFGSNIYDTRFETDGKVLHFSMINQTRMSYKFIPMVGPGGLIIHLLVYPIEEGILFYGVCSVDSISFFGIERTKKDSFYYRIEALQRWFRSKYGIPE